MTSKGMIDWENNNQGLMITPLLDLMFLVLIFFALNLSYEKFNALEVLVPQSRHILSLNAVDEPHFLQVNKGGAILLDNVSMNLQEMRDEITLLNSNTEELVIYVAGDREVEYSQLMSVLDELTSIGVYQINLISEED